MPTDAARGLVARIKALRRESKAWSKKHHMCPDDYHSASFVVCLLDMYEEHRLLSIGEQWLWRLYRNKMTLIIAQRAAYWKQHGKFRALWEGDTNTKYFHARASSRARQNTIHTLEVDGVQLIVHEDKVTIVAEPTNL